MGNVCNWDLSSSRPLPSAIPRNMETLMDTSATNCILCDERKRIWLTS